MAGKRRQYDDVADLKLSCKLAAAFTTTIYGETISGWCDGETRLVGVCHWHKPNCDTETRDVHAKFVTHSFHQCSHTDGIVHGA
jgi:hypothetical protein